MLKKVTRSRASKRQQQEIKSLATGSSPVKSTKSKKSPPIRDQQKAALPAVSKSINSLERKRGTIAQAVIEMKQTKSSKEEHSMESESDFIVPQAKMNAPFDKKFEYLLDTYCYVKSDEHEIWQAFVENDILTYDYDEFVDSQNLESLKEMKRTKGTTSDDAFSSGKLILVNNILLY